MQARIHSLLCLGQSSRTKHYICQGYTDPSHQQCYLNETLPTAGQMHTQSKFVVCNIRGTLPLKFAVFSQSDGVSLTPIALSPACTVL